MDQSKRLLDQLDLGDKDELVVSIKTFAESKFFRYGESGQLRKFANRHRKGPSHLEYHQRKVGPEWLFELTLNDGGIGIADASRSAVESITELVALAVKTHRQERRATWRCSRRP